jgi:hypothetical protein
MHTLASAESFLGSLFFGLMLGAIGVIAGFLWCRRNK